MGLPGTDHQEPAPVVIWAAPGVRVPGATQLSEGVFLRGGPLIPKPRPSGPTALALHGCGVFDGSFVRSLADVQRVLERAPGRTSNDLGAKIRGVLTLYLWRPREEVVDILPDPWGGLVHHFQDGTVHLFSSDLGALVETMGQLGYRPRRSLDFVTEVAAAGSGGLCPSSYEDVEVLDVFEYVQISSAGARIQRYSVAEEVLTPFGSYDEGIDSIRAEVETNLQAVARVDDLDVLAHLTGGVDTRMVLAATRALGLTSRFTYLSLGPETMPDRRIAGRLAVEYDLTMTQWRGTETLRNPTSVTEQARWPMDFSHGLRTSGPHRHMTGSDAAVLSGGFGGYFKGNYSKKVEGAPPEVTRMESARVAERIWGTKAYSADPEVGLYSTSVLDRRIDRFHSMRVEAASMGLDAAAALDWLFIAVRNRYFVMQTSRGWSAYTHRFDPLYCLSGARLALSLSSAERAANSVVFDLLRGWDSNLLELPFDTPRMNDAYQALRGPVTPREFSDPDGQPRFDGRGPTVQPRGRRADLDPVTPDVVARANAMNAPLWQVRDLERAREALREIVAGMGRTERDAIFNWPRLNGLLRWELKHRGPIRQIHHLHSTLLWYAKG